jgi:hypothetical protein
MSVLAPEHVRRRSERLRASCSAPKAPSTESSSYLGERNADKRHHERRPPEEQPWDRRRLRPWPEPSHPRSRRFHVRTSRPGSTRRSVFSPTDTRPPRSRRSSESRSTRLAVTSDRHQRTADEAPYVDVGTTSPENSLWRFAASTSEHCANHADSDVLVAPPLAI